MSIRYECEHCGSVLKIKADLSGKPGKCPKCKTAFTVPDLDATAESSGEIAAVENSDDAEPMLANAKAGKASEDFDLDAFLMDDDGANPSKSSRSAPSLKDEPAPRSEKRSKANKDDEGDTFAIRRGPDAPDKRPKPALMPGESDEDSDEQPTPSRRPPGTNPNAPASNIASDLLSKSAKKGKKTSWDEVQPEKRDEDQFDWQGLRREVLAKAAPIVVGGVVLCWLLFKLVNSSLSDKSFVPPLGQVTGTVTLNAKPVVGATVWFHPENKTMKSGDKEFKITASMAITDAAGHYELTYVEDYKGAVIGTCHVQIEAPGYPDVAAQYLGDKPTATQTVKKGKQVIDLELSK